METVRYQFFVFLYTLYGGIIIGISYDIYRVLRGKGKKEKSFTSIWDVLFLVVVFLICVWALFSSSYGERRIYELLGFFIGFILYEKVLGRFAIKLFFTIKKTLVKFFNTTNSLLILPFKIIYNLLWYPILKIIMLIKKVMKSLKRIGRIPKIAINDSKKYYDLIIKKQIKK